MKGGMKGIEDFFYVLIAALILIGIFMAVSALWPYSPGGTGPGGTENITVSEFSLGTVGYAEDQPVSSGLGTFTVGETQEEVLKSVPQIEISSGWFGGNVEEYTIQVPSHYRESMRDILLSFNVYDTNQYGNLNVKWNGKNFYNEKAPRSRVVVDIDANYIEDENTLEISADGPGLRSGRQPSTP